MDSVRLQLQKLKVPQLQNIARYFNLHKRIAFSKLRKAELIDALFEHINFTPALDINYKQPRKALKPKLQRQISTETASHLSRAEQARLELQQRIEAQKEIERMRQARGQRMAPIPYEQTEAGIRRRQFEEGQARLRQRLAELEAQMRD